MRGWSDEDQEKLVGWMEENQEVRRGAAVYWMKKAKQAVFADNEDIDVKKIKSKYHNMKNSWKAAKKLQEGSRFGVEEDDCTSSVNAVLNKKCRFFWRLDKMFGTRPNNNPVVVTSDTLSPHEQPSESQFQSQPNPLVLDDWPDSEPDDRANDAPTPSPPPTSAAPALTSPRTQPRPNPSGSSRRNKGDGELKRLAKLNRSDWAEREEKRQKIQADTQIEVARIQAESQERIMDKQLQMQKEESERQMQIQREERELHREREERQFQMFQGMMTSMIQLVANRTNGDGV
ncbi:hypothetical protein V8E54_012420 [Elaphomyces granulatus]|jgi:hypothetical protein